MDSKFGALQFLVLPVQATSGKRIVLDGVNGRIQIFDANNGLVVQMDPDTQFEILDPATGASIVEHSANPPAILFTPDPVFGVHAVDHGSIGADEQTVPDRARLLIDSPTLDGASRSQITLEHATVDIPKMFLSSTVANEGARLEVFGDIEASSAGTGRQGDILVDQESQTLHSDVFDVTTAGDAKVTITHGANFTPRNVIVVNNRLDNFLPGVNWWSAITGSYTATTFRAQFRDSLGGAVVSSRVVGRFICWK